MATTSFSASGVTTTTTPGAPPVGTTPGTSSTIYSQPQFDQRIRRLAQPFGTGTTPIQRGYMVWDPSVPWVPPYGGSAQTFTNAPKVLFLYNPSTIEASYTISQTSFMSSLLYPVTTLSVTPRVMLQQQVGFTIMFDRTYEMNSGDQTALMQQYGVELDVLAMKQFTGMFASLDNTTGNSGSNPTTGSSGNQGANPITNPSGIMQGVMQVAYSYVEFSPGSGIQYYGYVDEWDVQYTHFNQNMIPMRCVIDVSFTLMPPPSGNAAGSSAVAASQLTDPTTGLPVRIVGPIGPQ
jgi:hypothetical protein